MIAAFIHDLRLITLIDGGNPWTLIWRPPGLDPQDDIRAMQALWALQHLGAANSLWLQSNLSLVAMASPQPFGLASIHCRAQSALAGARSTPLR